MKRIVLAAALALIAAPASATLQLSIGANGSVFTCSDGEVTCDLSGGANNLLTVDTSVGGAFVQLTLTQSSFGAVNELQLSSSNIENLTGAPLTVTLLASDTGFMAPATFIENSGSLTFNSNVGAPDSTLKFWADAANTQGANPTNTPGALLETVSGHAVARPRQFLRHRDFAVDATFAVLDDRGREPGVARRRIGDRLQSVDADRRRAGTRDLGDDGHRFCGPRPGRRQAQARPALEHLAGRLKAK